MPALEAGEEEQEQERQLREQDPAPGSRTAEAEPGRELWFSVKL